jgi:hypothetical protein
VLDKDKVEQMSAWEVVQVLKHMDANHDACNVALHRLSHLYALRGGGGGGGASRGEGMLPQICNVLIQEHLSRALAAQVCVCVCVCV